MITGVFCGYIYLEQDRRHKQQLIELKEKEHKLKKELEDKEKELKKALEAKRQRKLEADRQRQLADKKHSERGTRSSSTKDLIKTELTWDYNYSSLYIPPRYKTELKEEGIFFKEYYWETSQDMPGYTVTDLEDVFFSVRLENQANHPVRIKFQITAVENFSIVKSAQKAIKTGFWSLMGAAAGSYFSHGDSDAMKAGAAIGAGASLANQSKNNEWFAKKKTFTEKLASNEVKYVTGKFILSKYL